MNKKDKCVSCKKETQYDEFDHIDFRNFYIEGAGQLCPECYNEIYQKIESPIKDQQKKEKD